MKKSSSLLALILTGVALFSCSKNAGQDKSSDTFQKATILTEKLPLCLWGRDEKMHGVSRLNKADTVEIVYTDGKINSKEVDGTVYLNAVYDSCDYWVDGTKLALDSVPAVIIENTIPYEDKKFKTPLEEQTLKFGKTVALACSEEYVTDEAQMIFFLDSKDDVFYSAWVKKDSISSRVDDIVVMQVVEGLRVTKRAVPRNELFKKAAGYNPCPKVAAALEAEKVEKVVNNYQDVLNALPGAKIKVNIQELLTVDQSKDPFK